MIFWTRVLYSLAIAGCVCKFSTMSPNVWNGNLLNCSTTLGPSYLVSPGPMTYRHTVLRLGECLAFTLKILCWCWPFKFTLTITGWREVLTRPLWSSQLHLSVWPCSVVIKECVQMCSLLWSYYHPWSLMKTHWDKLGQVSYMWVTRRSRNSEVHAAILYAFSWGSTTFHISVDIWNNYVCSCEAFLASGTHIVWMHPLPPRTLWPI